MRVCLPEGVLREQDVPGAAFVFTVVGYTIYFVTTPFFFFLHIKRYKVNCVPFCMVNHNTDTVK